MKAMFASVLLVAVSSVVGAQDPAFDVASVKVVGMGPTYRLTGGSYRLFPPGEASFSNTQLRTIVGAALDVPPQWQELRIVWPERLEPLRMGPRFDIQAKGDPRHGTPAMLRTLLKERFGLAFHRETRTVPVYALTVKDPARLRLRPVPYNCREFMAGGGRPGDANSPRDGEREVCFDSRFYMRASAGTIAQFIETVAVPGVKGEMPVIDATGLTGNYTWEVRNFMEDPQSVVDNLEDVGLALQRTTAPWEVIVIDHIEMPTPN
jgi:uncharacterized protein (TIGR03435 family)